jgi:hypothetical protein
VIKAGSQKIVGSNSLSSTIQTSEANIISSRLSICPNSQASLSILLHCLIDIKKHNARANRPVSPLAVKSYYIGLSDLFSWAMGEELIEHNPMANVKKPKLPNRTVKGLEPKIIKMLLNTFNGRSINDLRNKAMLLIYWVDSALCSMIERALRLTCVILATKRNTSADIYVHIIKPIAVLTDLSTRLYGSKSLRYRINTSFVISKKIAATSAPTQISFHDGWVWGMNL